MIGGKSAPLYECPRVIILLFYGTIDFVTVFGFLSQHALCGENYRCE